MRITRDLINLHETPPQQLNTMLLIENNRKGGKDPNPRRLHHLTVILYLNMFQCVSLWVHGDSQRALGKASTCFVVPIP